MLLDSHDVSLYLCAYITLPSFRMLWTSISWWLHLSGPRPPHVRSRVQANARTDVAFAGRDVEVLIHDTTREQGPEYPTLLVVRCKLNAQAT